MTRILALILLLLTALPAEAQEQGARGFVERLLESMLSAEGRSLSIQNTSISLTGDVTVGRVEVKDGENAWLVIENLSLVWRPLSLFGKQLEVTSLTAGRVHMLRMPATPEGTVAAPQELKDLTAAAIKQLEIGTLQIDQPVLGQDVAMKLGGSGEITAAPVQILADLTASRLDGKKGDLRLKLALDPRTRNVQASVSFSEESDGILANLLSLRGDPSVDLALEASGTYADWKGSFSLDLDKSRVFDGNATGITTDGGQTITVEGGGAMAQVLPSSLEQTFGGTSQLSASVRLPAGSGTAEFDHVSLDNAAFRFNLSGLADWEGETSDLVAVIAAKNAEALFDLPETGSLGKASIAGLKAGVSITGSLKAPDWRVSLDWADLASDRISLKPISARLEGRGVVATSDAPVSFTGSVTGGVGQGRDGNLPPVLTGPLSGSVSGNWRVDGLLGITMARLAIGTSEVEATGTVDPFGGQYDLNVKARTDSPATGAALLDKLLDGRVEASGHLTGGGPDGFSLEDLRFSSPAISVNSTGRADGKSADLALSVSLPDLGVLRNGLGGRASFNASLKGPWSALDASLDGAGKDVRLLNKDFDAPKFLARITFSGGRPQGDISMSGTLDGRPVGIHGTFETDATGVTILRDFNASSGSARASGSLVWPAAGHPTGQITFDAPDLRDVGPLVLLDLSGTLSGSIDLTGEGASHKTAIAFTGRNVASGDVAAGKAEGSVTIANLFDEPQPSGSATFGKLRIGTQSFDTATIKAEPNGANGYRATASFKGRDLSADAEADVVIAEDSTTYSLARLSGMLRGTAFKAAAPFVVRQTKDGVSIDSATLNVGKGTVKLAGRMAPSLDLRASIAALPLGAFETLARVPGLRGTLSGEAALKGDASAPQGQYKLSATGLTATALQGLRMKPLNATANGTIAGQSITVSVKADGGPDLSITGDGKADLGRSTIDMKVKGRAGSRLFNDKLADSGLRAEGNLSFDLRVAGPLAKPAITGELALAKGVIGDTAGQFTVREAQGRASMSGNVIRIVSLTGKTGRKGSASASGTISLDGSLNADLRVNIKDGIYTDGSFVTSRYNADLAIRGPLRGGPVVSGDVGLRDTKITLSELPRRAIKPDDVKHIRAPAPVRRQAKELERFRQGGGSSLDVDLMLRALDPISVNGRGLNVVLTGDLRVFGPLNNLGAQGSFEMLRGRLALPARNLDFERGSLTFDRNFDPLINFVAVSRRTDATITLAVTGHASEPSIKVTSMPQMPEEEALALLIFNSSMLELSPIQIAQIASYVATVTGGGGGGILSGLQAAMGLDFTVGTNEQGETQVGVAKQINDRLSIGVEQTTKSNTTRVNIDLSATPNIKLRGSVDSDRSSRIGVYYEKDY